VLLTLPCLTESIKEHSHLEQDVPHGIAGRRTSRCERYSDPDPGISNEGCKATQFPTGYGAARKGLGGRMPNWRDALDQELDELSRPDGWLWEGDRSELLTE
jgi:hypothetical protein